MKMTKRRWWMAGGLLLVAGIGVLLYRPNAGASYHIEALGYGLHDPAFERTLTGVLGSVPVGGNSIEVLQNGDEIFPAMLQAIRSAERSVNFETYVFGDGEIARTFTDALSERARAGVDVNVIVDAFGGMPMPSSFRTSMESAGARFCLFEEPSVFVPDPIAEANCRTHRKLLIVDGRVAFLGGVGIGDAWRGDARDPSEWRDVHFRVEGNVVALLQAAFCENWMEAAGEVLHGEVHYPALSDRGDARAIAVYSSPEGKSGDVQKMFLLAIAGAQKSIRIATPYFVPDELTLDHLCRARERGVTIDIIVAGPHTDTPVSRHASRHLWGDLLATGVSIYEYLPTMYHCKYMIVDGAWTSIGSANFDNRSFKLNDEANLVVLDADFATQLERTFDADCGRARRVTLAEWKQRPWPVRFKESAAALLREHL
ncbi:MAG: cardiolipin synthase B [Phycisphaerales bacterium]|nr:cardiolipin synthase B [Phycisphaerales bacterium]